jgi:SSS family solute:Na+ symporter
MIDSITWIFIFLVLYWSYCFFWGVRASRQILSADDYFLSGRNLSPWVFAIAATGISFAGWTFIAHPGLIFRDGFQFANTSFFAIAVAISGVVLLKRQWMLGRRFGFTTSGEMLAAYFKDDTLRIISVGIALLFGIPFAALLFGSSGFLISELTNGIFSRNVAMWSLSGFVLLYSIMGGMQAIAKISVVQTILFFLGMIILGLFALDLVGGFDSLNQGLANMAKSLTSHLGKTKGMGGGNFPGYFAIPGVIQFTDGIGVETPKGGPWTAIMTLTFMMSVMGIQSSPTFTMLGFTSKSAKGLSIHQIWGAAACVGIIMFLFSTLQGISANLLGANSAVNKAGFAVANYLPELSKAQYTELVMHYIKLVGNTSPWMVGFLAICAVAALQVTAAAFMSTTGNILCRDIYVQYFRKDADYRLQIKAAKLFTALVFLCGMLLASFSMEATLILGGLAIAFSFQLWPSLLSITWFPWITKSGAIAGLIIGLIVVIFTETLGQKITGGKLPWGVWPWNIHSAVWGMFFNISICLIVSLMTSEDPDREHRNTFHSFIQKHSITKANDRWSKPVGGLLLMVWMFFAIGPGSIFGNFIFGKPNKGYDSWMLGMPSIWAWQIIWWALGVGVIWFLANKLRMSTEPETEIKPISSE